MKNNKKKWTRSCPGCNRIIEYSYTQSFNLAIKNNTRCIFCSKVGENNPAKRSDVREKISKSKQGENNPMYGKKRSDHSEKMKIIMNGKNNPMYGRSVYDVWLKKYGKREANKKQSDVNKKRRQTNLERYGVENVSQIFDVRRKLSDNAIKRYKNPENNPLNDRCVPNYNSEGCKFIEEYGTQNGYNFKHAENGGEVCIGGYYPDGCDEKRKTLMEIDEKHHFNSDGSLKKRDVERQNYLEKLGYKVIRVRL